MFLEISNYRQSLGSIELKCKWELYKDGYQNNDTIDIDAIGAGKPIHFSLWNDEHVISGDCLCGGAALGDVIRFHPGGIFIHKSSIEQTNLLKEFQNDKRND